MVLTTYRKAVVIAGQLWTMVLQVAQQWNIHRGGGAEGDRNLSGSSSFSSPRRSKSRSAHAHRC